MSLICVILHFSANNRSERWICCAGRWYCWCLKVGSSVRLDNPQKHQVPSDALECGSLLFLPSWGAKTPFAQEIAKASFNTMHARMDIEPEEWVHWRQPNKAIFAIRSWGGILWRWIANKVIRRAISFSRQVLFFLVPGSMLSCF